MGHFQWINNFSINQFVFPLCILTYGPHCINNKNKNKIFKWIIGLYRYESDDRLSSTGATPSLKGAHLRYPFVSSYLYFIKKKKWELIKSHQHRCKSYWYFHPQSIQIELLKQYLKLFPYILYIYIYQNYTFILLPETKNILSDLSAAIPINHIISLRNWLAGK